MAAWIGGSGVPSARGQVDSPSSAGKNADSKVADGDAAKAAADFMKNVQEALYARMSIKADVEQMVSIGAQQFRVDGQYLSSGQKLRLEFTIRPDQGVSGSLLEVCDGKELWSMMKVGDVTRVTHRDVQQIKAAVAGIRNMPDVVLTAELGLGGLTALLASLERTMNYDAMKEESADGTSRIIVQGRWKPDVVSRWPRGKDDLLPVYVPDLVRIWVDPESMFPTRITYIKRVVEKDKKVYRPMVNLSFRNVEFDVPVGDEEFTFVTPDDVVPEDITRQFLDRMKKSAEAKSTEPASPPKD